jgi:hypothetical protein
VDTATVADGYRAFGLSTLSDLVFIRAFGVLRLDVQVNADARCLDPRRWWRLQWGGVGDSQRHVSLSPPPFYFAKLLLEYLSICARKVETDTIAIQKGANLRY